MSIFKIICAHLEETSGPGDYEDFIQKKEGIINYQKLRIIFLNKESPM